jgi:hypothetical protein
MRDMRPPPGYLPPRASAPPEHDTAREMGNSVAFTARDMGNSIADVVADVSRWLGRVVTIAVGVCLGMLLFVWVAGQWLRHELRQETPIPSWPTSITWPTPTTSP